MKKILYGIMVKNKLVGIDQSLNVCFQDFDFGGLIIYHCIMIKSVQNNF